MSNARIFKLTVLAVGLLLTATGAYATPILQVYLEGATYDIYSQTWVLDGGTTDGTARLWVLGNVGSTGGVEDVHLAAAYDSAFAPQIVLTPSAPETRIGFADPSQASAPTTDGTVHTGRPVLNDGSVLPGHGVYGDGVVWEQFDLGDFVLEDSPIANFDHGFPTSFSGMGQINVYDLTVTGEGLPEDFTVHFDVYNHVFGDTRSIFAPMSHDGEYDPHEEFPPVPEPLSMVMFGCIGAGMIAARKLRRRK